MATVHWPGNEVARVRAHAHLSGIPFILTDSEEYPPGVNAYIFERARGKVSVIHGSESRVLLRPIRDEARRKLAYNLADLLTWGETPRAHPDQGTIRWDQFETWHILDLYQDSLITGYWTENFFRTKWPSPIAPESVRTRVGHALGCYRWMADNGFISNFDYEPTHQVVTLSKDACLLSYRKEQQQVLTNSVPIAARPFRKSPGNQPLPTLPHLHAFFSALSPGPHRLIALQLFETGMRAEEALENTLIPGRLHERSLDPKKWHFHPSWSEEPVQLAWSLDDDRMIGVIPPRRVAERKMRNSPAAPDFAEPNPDYGYQCAYRILGKGPKVRLAHLPPKLVVGIWNYIEGARLRHRPSDLQAHVYLDRNGTQLEYHALWAAFDRANAKIKSPLRITPHVLRHAYACYFLEAAIIKEGRERGYDRDTIPPKLILEHGSNVILTLQNDLGHALASSTRRYLDQVAKGWIRLSTHEAWNQLLDEQQFDD